MDLIDIKQAVCFSFQTKWPPYCLQLLKTEIVFLKGEQLKVNVYYSSAGNRGNFAARLLGKMAERLIDYNRLFSSLPVVNYHLCHSPPKTKKKYNFTAQTAVARNKTIWSCNPWQYTRNINNK